MAHRRRRHVDEDAFAANLVVADVAAHQPADAQQTAALAAIDERRLQVTDQHVFVVGQRAARLQQSAVGPENRPHRGRGKVVQRQARDDEIVEPFAGQQFDGAVDQLHLFAIEAERPLLLEALVEQADKARIDLDEIKAIIGVEMAENLLGDGAGARSDLKDAGRPARLAQLGDESASEKATAG